MIIFDTILLILIFAFIFLAIGYTVKSRTIIFMSYTFLILIAYLLYSGSVLVYSGDNIISEDNLYLIQPEYKSYDDIYLPLFLGVMSIIGAILTIFGERIINNESNNKVNNIVKKNKILQI